VLLWLVSECKDRIERQLVISIQTAWNACLQTSLIVCMQNISYVSITSLYQSVRQGTFSLSCKKAWSEIESFLKLHCSVIFYVYYSLVQIDCRDSEIPIAKKLKLDWRENKSLPAKCSSTKTMEALSSCKPIELKQVIEPLSEAEVSGNNESVEILSPGGAAGTQEDPLAKEEVSKEHQHQTATFKTDGLEDSLLCSICQDILHNCIRYSCCKCHFTQLHQV